MALIAARPVKSRQFTQGSFRSHRYTRTGFRLHAARMADEFAAIDTRAEILPIVRQVTPNLADGALR